MMAPNRFLIKQAFRGAVVTSFFFGLLILGFWLIPTVSSAQELHLDYQGTYRGKVIEILAEEWREIPGTETDHLYQTIKAEILDGPQVGKILTIENDYLELDKGNKFYFNYNIDLGGQETYGIVNIDRRDSLILLTTIFILAVVVFGGWQGVRALFALVGSFFVIVFILMPGLLNGWNPLLASFLVASGILFAAIFFTHGFNRESAVAYGGTMIAVLLTGIFAILAVHWTDLSGFAAEESVYLNFNTQGSLDFTALLLGAIIIGVLGVLDDIAVTQAAVVTELFNSNPKITRQEAYKRALRVGREHVGALVNTLVLAYTGAALPLLLYFYLSPVSFGATVNSEIFATEIVRMIVGSIGLIMTVPIVTLLAVIYLKDYKPKDGKTHSHH
ncbi:MAG: YibE/F family protein [Candidatus Vogelbacteria bacterium]|nr:YibE/F family protein [Candidatus Vogelbacteria bacterium]